jgi:RND family efflux transporter MFP subunit
MTASKDLLNELRIDRGSAAPPPRAGGRTPWLGIGLAVLVVAAAGTWWATREQPLPVRTVVAEAETAGTVVAANSVLDASGYVTARRIATVSAKITGKVLEVLIEEGQSVEEGEILARLEPTDANAQRALSLAQLQAAQSDVARVQAQLDMADKTLARNTDLAAQRLIATALLDQAKSERAMLAAQLDSSRRNVQVAREALAMADNGVDNTVVRAPFAGVVTVKAAQPGEIISPMSSGGFTRTGIGTIVDMASLEIQVDVNEAFIGRVKPGQKVEAVLNAYPDWRIPAEVIAIVPTADRSKATVKVRIAFRERDARVVPDMGVRVSFLGDEPASAAGAPAIVGVSVPAEAVVLRDGVDVVYVVSEGRADARTVEAGDIRDGKRRITSGLAAGETIVLAPPAELADGAKVEPQS